MHRTYYISQQHIFHLSCPEVNFETLPQRESVQKYGPEKTSYLDTFHAVCRMDSLTNPKLITVSFNFQPKSHQKSHDEVNFLNPAKHQVGFEPPTFLS